MYFETGQGSELSSQAHHGTDQVTMEARCYGFAKRFHQTIVLVSHDPEMTEYADRIVTLIDGRIVSNVENQVKAEIDAAPYIE